MVSSFRPGEFTDTRFPSELYFALRFLDNNLLFDVVTKVYQILPKFHARAEWFSASTVCCWQKAVLAVGAWVTINEWYYFFSQQLKIFCILSDDFFYGNGVTTIQDVPHRIY